MIIIMKAVLIVLCVLLRDPLIAWAATYSVKGFGAVGDGKTDDSKVILFFPFLFSYLIFLFVSQ